MIRSHVLHNPARRVALMAGVVGTLGLAASLQAQVTQQVTYANFNSTGGLTLNGSAQTGPGLGSEGNTLQITPPAAWQAGTAWLNAKQVVSEAWSTSFQFRIRDRGTLGADGLTFCIQNSAAGTSARGGAGGAMGYATNLTYPSGNQGIANAVAITFDTWDNHGDWNAIRSSNLISVQTNADPTADGSLGSFSPQTAFNDGGVHRVRIDYVPGTLAIYYDNFASPALTINQFFIENVLSLSSSPFGGLAYVGFTGATGAEAGQQRQEILNWSFTGAIPTPASATVLALGGLMAARRRRA